MDDYIKAIKDNTGMDMLHSNYELSEEQINELSQAGISLSQSSIPSPYPFSYKINRDYLKLEL